MKRGFLNQKLGKRMSRKSELDRARIEAMRGKAPRAPKGERRAKSSP